jgi:predicted small lipoprotein YifL
MSSIKRFTPFLVLLSITLAACGKGGPTTNHPDPTSTPFATNLAPKPTSTEVAVPSGSEPLVSQAIANLALRLQVTEAVIQVVSVEAVEWRDTSLGCPQPGMMYAQVVTPGHQIVLQVGENLYMYHTDEGELFVFCDSDVVFESFMRDSDATVKDGDPNQPREGDVIILPPTERK